MTYKSACMKFMSFIKNWIHNPWTIGLKFFIFQSNVLLFKYIYIYIIYFGSIIHLFHDTNVPNIANAALRNMYMYKVHVPCIKDIFSICLLCTITCCVRQNQYSIFIDHIYIVCIHNFKNLGHVCRTNVGGVNRFTEIWTNVKCKWNTWYNVNGGYTLYIYPVYTCSMIMTLRLIQKCIPIKFFNCWHFYDYGYFFWHLI